jgi:SPP1 gp7 family putative phage head morphogenesis protein
VQTGLISKAEDDLYPDLDPLDDDDFVVILERLSLELREATENQEAKALRDALDLLDVNWPALSAAAIDRLISAAAAILAGSVDKIIPRTSRIFEAAARAVIPPTKRRVVDREQLGIGGALSTPDKETGAALLRHQGLYIRDEYGRRADAAAARARQIVASGIERGLGQQEMAAQLAADITLRHLGRAKSYWEVVATAFSNRARTSTQLNSYEEAGIKRFRFVAVLDEATTDICRYMDGRIFAVRDALALQRRAERMTVADDIKNLQPWVSAGVEDGRSILYFERNGHRQRVAYVDQSAVGRQDARGVFSGGMTDAQLAAAGILVPPLHARCRSTIVSED